MAGIISSRMDGTCSMHNALRNITGYACGVTFSFKDSNNPPDMHYGVVSLQRCCDKVNAPLQRISGNTGCEMQFCDVQPVESPFTSTIHFGFTTGTGTAAQTPAPSVTKGTRIGPPAEVENCIQMVSKGDLPDDIADQILKVENWGIASYNSDGLPFADQQSPILASPAPPSWTSAAAKSGDMVSSSSTPINTPDPTFSSTSLPGSSHTPSTGLGSSYRTEHSHTGLKVWAVTALIAIGFVIAL